MKEKFSWEYASLVLSIHALALGGIIYYSGEAIAAWLVAHFFFVAFGIVLGHHRYFSHNSFEAVPWFRKFLAIASTMTLQGGPLFWASSHRIHHRQSEKTGDPHSAARGFFWSHMGWLFYQNPNEFSYVRARAMIPDLARDPFLMFLEKYAHRLNFMIMILAALVLGMGLGRYDLFFWIFPIRIVSGWHSTWFLNSYTHRAPLFSKKEEPQGKEFLRNSYLFQFLHLGDGFHKNHHYRPSSAHTGDRWYHMDFSYGILKCLEKVGVVSKIRVHHEIKETKSPLTPSLPPQIK